MKRLIVALIVGAVGGTVAGFGAGLFIYPFWFLNDVAVERLSADLERTKLAEGEFRHVNPADPVHWGRGTVTTYREGGNHALVHLHSNFEVGPGPRFHIYLVERADVASAGDFVASEKIDLGRLRAFRGSQIYHVPSGTEVSKFASVVVWCKEFSVLISPATLMKDVPPVALSSPD